LRTLVGCYVNSVTSTKIFLPYDVVFLLHNFLYREVSQEQVHNSWVIAETTQIFHSVT